MKHVESLKTLVGDIAAAMLEELQALPKVWQELGAIDQTLIADRAGLRAFTLASEAIRLATQELAGDAILVPAVLESVSAKDAVKATVKLIGPRRFDVAAHVGGEVGVLIAADAESLLGKPPAPKFREIPPELQADAFPLAFGSETARGVSDAA
jgi:hypothetical protein